MFGSTDVAAAADVMATIMVCAMALVMVCVMYNGPRRRAATSRRALRLRDHVR